ncbi:MAG: ABC-F family ATP-binding cassette domain-containing protein [Clostridia bacterium]|jgi:ATP-binding cassette subfamily F protein uup|nr:ABC-F family ATP-binding cassette domain-containing protein [Clostridia bacterium]
MANLLMAENLKKTYGIRNILDDITFTINEGEHIGLIGINGTGKSTLLKIIAGVEESDSGKLIVMNGVRIAYLPQNPVFQTDTNVLDQVFWGVVPEKRLELEYEAKAILTRLDITGFDRDVNTLSGGQRKRIALAAVLLNEAELLVLDEPTNHLDSSMVEWLEKYLETFKGAILMVTHDRYFLNRVTQKIWEIDNGKIYTYEGNYSTFLELKAGREEMAQASERKRQSLFKQELSWIRQGAKARSTKAKFRVERFNELSAAKGITEKANVAIKSVASRLGKKTIEINHLDYSWNAEKLINDFDYIVLRDDRIGIIGKNGSGKTTLLKLITGEITPDSGSVVIGETVKIGYFAQENTELPLNSKVIDYIREGAEYVQLKEGTVSASQMLERFLFSPAMQHTLIEKLSGGEKRRLYLLRVLIEAPNILLLDEPTNDLDIETLTILEDYLQSFAGAVITVSHDRYFLDKTVNRIFAFQNDGTLKQYEGGYSDYALAISEEEEAEIIKNNTAKAEKSNNSIVKQRKLKFSYKEELEYKEIDDIIAGIEAEIIEVEKALVEEAANFTVLPELLAKKAKLEKELETKMERWLYLNDLAEQIAKQ